MEAILARAYVNWFNDFDGPDSPLGEFIAIFAFLALLGILATSWHRFMILGEVPGLVPRLKPSLVLRYVLAWIVIGLVVGLIVLLCVGVPVLLLGVVIDPLLGQLMLNVIAPDPYLVVDGGLFPALLLSAIAALAGFLYLYLLFRMGMAMPSVAVRDGQGIAMRASWRATRDLARPIGGAALLAVLGQAALFAASYGAYSMTLDWETETLRFAHEYAGRLAYVVADTLTTLIGAAILTRIYRALPSAPV
ncbi:hypothetical protein [Hasllibacter sp. MH4015]|uniref:hypothetical protein n=1 Tax=Hasllibacter sp. MH4015 TaxID=2854029 RepID=UPI001CD297A7|nr:hypothetical protein [Hasllibacter sp. MH4015]